MEKYLEIAKYIRNKIELNKNKLHTSIDFWFKDFPIACCDKSSEIILKYLNDNLISWFKIIYKYWIYKRYDYEHVWIENDTLVIDITADQFNWKIEWENFNKITVTKKEDYFFNKIEWYFSEYNWSFIVPSEWSFNYLEFYNLYIKNEGN